jgi:type IV pilus assembly protein PilC
MPTFQYEAMDNTGREVKDTIDASTQEEAQQLIRQKGFFVTKISERSKAKKKGPASGKKGGRKGKKKAFTIGKISTKQLCTFTRQLSTLQDAGLPILRSLKILHGQCKPGGHRVRCHALRRLRQAPQGIRQALLQHDQGR